MASGVAGMLPPGPAAVAVVAAAPAAATARRAAPTEAAALAGLRGECKRTAPDAEATGRRGDSVIGARGEGEGEEEEEEAEVGRAGPAAAGDDGA